MIPKGWTGSSARVQEPLKGKTGLNNIKGSLESSGQHRGVDRLEPFSVGSREAEQGQRAKEAPVGRERRQCRAHEKKWKLSEGPEGDSLPHTGVSDDLI